MGAPIAANLLRAGTNLVVFNRTLEKTAPLAALGARVAPTVDALFDSCEAVILMLANDEAVDEVLGRGQADFQRRVQDCLLINMGTHSQSFSKALGEDVRRAGGQFVEAPVSGSRGPAETGELVAMLAGAPGDVETARDLLRPACCEIIETGLVPSALAMKLTINLYLIASVAALAETAHLASRLGLDLGRLRRIIAAGPLNSSVALAKLDKMTDRDFSAQASIDDVCKNAALVVEAARGLETPLLRESQRLFDTVREAGHGAMDMAAVLTAYERTQEHAA